MRDRDEIVEEQISLYDSVVDELQDIKQNQRSFFDNISEEIQILKRRRTN